MIARYTVVSCTIIVTLSFLKTYILMVYLIACHKTNYTEDI